MVVMIVILRERNLRRSCVVSKKGEDDERHPRDEDEDGEEAELYPHRYFNAPPVIPRTKVSMNRL
jgi:hypothetical protein